MIFVTVGTQEPFDRLVKIIDEWVDNKDIDLFGQLANGKYVPKHFSYKNFMEPSEYSRLFNEAELIVSHAGMGSIISAMKADKPILVFPRQSALKEHRNDHQMATSKSFSKMGFVNVAFDEAELIEKLNDWQNLRSLHKINNHASKTLTDFLKNYFSNPAMDK